MQDRSTAEPDTFDRLLDAMPRVAEAFSSPKTQRAALDALVRSLGLLAPAVATGPTREPEEPNLSVVPPIAESPDDPEESVATAPSAEAQRAGRKPRTRKPAAKKSYPRVKDINFRPEGKTSLRDFAAQKDPRNFKEKNLVFVYYLEEFLEVEAIEVGHVLAAYDECGWKSPSIPDNSLVVTASTKHWLDTSDLSAIKTTHAGRNTVQYDMPLSKESKTA